MNFSPVWVLLSRFKVEICSLDSSTCVFSCSLSRCCCLDSFCDASSLVFSSSILTWDSSIVFSAWRWRFSSWRCVVWYCGRRNKTKQESQPNFQRQGTHCFTQGLNGHRAMLQFLFSSDMIQLKGQLTQPFNFLFQYSILIVDNSCSCFRSSDNLLVLEEEEMARCRRETVHD